MLLIIICCIGPKIAFVAGGQLNLRLEFFKIKLLQEQSSDVIDVKV
jgi:hypothetical protein